MSQPKYPITEENIKALLLCHFPEDWLNDGSVWRLKTIIFNEHWGISMVELEFSLIRLKSIITDNPNHALNVLKNSPEVVLYALALQFSHIEKYPSNYFIRTLKSIAPIYKAKFPDSLYYK